MRTALLTGVLVVTGVTVSAEAAPRKPLPCKTIVDPAGDSTSGASLDILSADIASNAKTLTVVFRLADATKTNSDAPTGQGYYFDFYAGGADPIYLSYTVTPTTEKFSYGWVETTANGTLHHSLGNASGKLDPATKELHISAPVGSWTTYGKPKPGTKITGIALNTYWVVGAYVDSPVTSTGAASLQPADDASGKTYVAGAASCVVPGK
jgi:hypothetical protein